MRAVAIRANVPCVGRRQECATVTVPLFGLQGQSCNVPLAKVCFADGNSVCFASSKWELCHNEESVRNTCAARGLNI